VDIERKTAHVYGDVREDGKKLRLHIVFTIKDGKFIPDDISLFPL
jgi:hypothetical protein